MRRPAWIVLLCLSILPGAAPAPAAECFQKIPLGSIVPDPELPAADGSKGHLLGTPGTHKVSVFVFFRPGQANSQSVLTELGDLAREFKNKPVHWSAVMGSSHPLSQAKEDFREAKLDLPFLIDEKEALAAQLGVVLHPVAGVTDEQHRMVFHHPYRAVSWGVRLKTMIRFQLGEIPKQELDSVLDPAPPVYGGGSAKALLHLHLAERLYAGKKLSLALAELEKCMKLDPDLAAAHSLLAQIAVEEKDCAAGRAALQTALKLDPKDPRALELKKRCGDR